MMEICGKGDLPPIMVAPTVVRGGSRKAEIGDLRSIREAAHTFPTTARGAAVSLGVSLEEFGARVLTKARQA